MQLFQKTSLQRKQTLIIMLTATVVLLLACAGFSTYEIISFRNSMVGNLSKLAEIVGNNVVGAIDSRDVGAAEEILSTLRAEPNIVAACIYTADCELLAKYHRSGESSVFTAPAAKPSGYSFGDHRLGVFHFIEHPSETTGFVYLESDLQKLYSRLTQYAIIAGTVLAIALLVAFVMSRRLQRIVSQPILELVETTRAVAANKDYGVRASKRTGDEIGILIDGFNEMLGQIQARDAELQKSKEVLEQRVEQRTRELANSLSLVNATLESTADGILVADGHGKVTSFNEQFATMWKIPIEIVTSGNEDKILKIALTRLKDPEPFLAKVAELYGHPEKESFDILEFEDGKILERYSKPQKIGDKCVGRVWSFRDITQRKRAEETVRRTEELYRRAIGGVGAVPYSYDYKTRTYLFMGEGIEQLIGYAPHEVTPEFWKKIIKETIMLGDAAGLDKKEAARRVTMGELKQWRCDMRMTTRDEKSRWISDTSVQIVDESGKPTGSIGILQDITERKQAEISALAFSRLGHQLSSAVSADEAAGIITEIADDLLGWNSCWVQLYSEKDDSIYAVFTADTIDGKRVYDTVPNVRKSTELHQRIAKSGAELVLREQSVSPLPGAISFGNESRLSASLMFAPIRSSARTVGIVSIQSYTPKAYDEQNLKTLQALADQCGGALERIWADEARQKSESQFRVVWNTSGDGMRLADEKGTVLMVNDAYCRMVGKSKVELEGHCLTVILHAEENREEALHRHAQRFASNSIHSHRELEITLWNGQRRWFELSNSIMRLPGQEPLLMTIFRDVTRRKEAEAELEVIHRQLLDASRQAGMAEVATGVLHNVGNVLNSVNVSASLVTEELRQSSAANLKKVVALLKQNEHELGQFFSKDARGKQLPGYLESLAEDLADEHNRVIKEMDLLQKNMEHIKDIVAMQQNYAKVSGVIETIKIIDLVEDALRMNAGALSRHQVQLIKEFSDIPPITVERHKVLQILVNLIRNAKYALDEGDQAEKRLIVRVNNSGGHVRIAVIDNGVGIAPENLTRIFSHGFTTRRSGHGFGLHSGSLAAKELGGSLTVQSDGIGKGATFVLEIPYGQKPSMQDN